MKLSPFWSLKPSIDVDEDEIKHRLAGIVQIHSLDELEEKQVAITNNLKPKCIFSSRSKVMNLTAEDEATGSLLVPIHPIRSKAK